MLGASSAPLEWIVGCLLVAFWLPPGHVAHNMQTNETDFISSSLNFTFEGFSKTKKRISQCFPRVSYGRLHSMDSMDSNGLVLMLVLLLVDIFLSVFYLSVLHVGVLLVYIWLSLFYCTGVLNVLKGNPQIPRRRSGGLVPIFPVRPLRRSKL